MDKHFSLKKNPTTMEGSKVILTVNIPSLPQIAAPLHSFTNTLYLHGVPEQTKKGGQYKGRLTGKQLC
jgi:hypothetical protein